MNSETYSTVNAAKKPQIALAVALPPKSSTDIAAVADEYATDARLFPMSSVVVVRPISESALCTFLALRPPARARCNMRSRLTERKAVSAPAQNAAQASARSAERKYNAEQSRNDPRSNRSPQSL